MSSSHRTPSVVAQRRIQVLHYVMDIFDSQSCDGRRQAGPVAERAEGMVEEPTGRLPASVVGAYDGVGGLL